MVVTRSQTTLVPDKMQKQTPPEEASEGTSSVQQHSAQGTRPHSVSTHTSRSSATAIAKKLAVEAQHARHLAKLEIAEMQAQSERRTAELELERRTAQLELERRTAELKLERRTAELELRAELAAIDVENSGKSCSGRSDTSVKKWLHCVESNQNEHNNNTTVLSSNNKNKQLQSTEIQVGENNPSSYPQLVRHDSVPPSAANPRPTTSQPSISRDGVHATGNYKGNDCMSRLADALELLAQRDGVPPTRAKHFNVSLPTFDGRSPLDWLMFKRAFFDTEQAYSTVENLARLNQALKGAAREAVGTLLVMARHAFDVVEALDRRFGRPEEIVVQEVNSIRALSKLGNEVRELNIFATRVRNCVEIARLLEHHDYLRSPELFGTLLSKLPHLLRTRWFDYAKVNWTGQPKVELLSNFLSHEVDLAMQFGYVTEATTSSHRERTHAVSEAGLAQGSCAKLGNKKNGNEDHLFCLCCEREHLLSNCDKFKKMTVDDRWQFIKEKKVCYRCLKEGSHNFRYCNRNKTMCEINNCNRKHHTLLHNPNYSRIPSAHISENKQTEPSKSQQLGEGSEQVIINTAAIPQDATLRPLLKIVPVTVTGPVGSVDTFALLDDGSTATFIDSEVANQIGAKGPAAQIHLDCVGGLSRDSAIQYVDFKIKGKHASATHLIRGARSINNLGLVRQTATQDSITSYLHLRDLTNELCYVDAKPTLIIGIDNWHLSVACETRQGLSKSQPVAIKTVLGWVVFGFSSSRTKPMEFAYHVSLSEYSDPRRELEVLIKEQYKLDVIGITKLEHRSVDDQRALQILNTTARRLPSGRFEVGLLWKTDNPVVPDSYPLALARFKSIEKQMLRDPQYAKRYSQNIHDMLDKGYAEQCPISSSNSICWYLPHFGVVNPNKPLKLRIVHDAAAKSQGVSLNSLLLPGPDFLQSLLGILMRFREGKVALTADIKEMFPQIKIRENDRDAQRFLWRDDSSSSIKTFRMSSMIFGACSSPSTAIFITNLNASSFQDESPDAVHAISTDTYVDDYIGSVDTVEKAARLASDITKIHERGGFVIRGWISNKPSALNLLPNELLSDTVIGSSLQEVELGTSNFTRTLGLIWQPISDVISFNIGLKNLLPNQLTKRVVLAQVMRIYDPLGILAPLVVRGRILFQNLWRKGLDWDDCLSETDENLWLDWYDNLNSLVNLRIPRCYNLSEMQVFELELHVFCDASEQAHVAVAYWRFIFNDGKTKLALISSKTRVSPLKPTSIPRLELQGALIGSRLANFICKAHRSKPNRRYFWCDSMTVLGWLRSDARNYKPFVSHRVGEIVENSEVREWHWVPSELNVADDATRGKLKTLNVESRWIAGPSFLLSPSSEWPCEPLTTSIGLDEEEIKPCFCPPKQTSSLSLFTTSEAIHFNHTRQLPLPVLVDITHFSSWLRMLRATARLHQFIAIIFGNRGHVFRNPMIEDIVTNFGLSSQNARNYAAATASATLKFLDAAAIDRAETHALMKSQIHSFGKELLCIIRKEPIPKNSRLSTLSPLLNEKGLIYLSGRISAAADVDIKVKRPIILDSKEPTVRLLIKHYHAKFAHANTETVINELRQQYWILGVRNAVRSVSRECQMCKLLRVPTMRPPMGDLPEARVTHHRKPFTITGLDYFGPLQVAVGRRREKRWVALFTCMVTRAVHLEVVHSLSSDSAIMCLRRFIARRGTPDTIYSDNGTAFVGANRQLRALSNNNVTDFAVTNKIKWCFIPPSAPFMGGAWERLVKSIKTALLVTLRERAPKDETLVTLLAEAESVVNTRPLTHVSPDPDYPEALTPNHFLLGESSRKTAMDTVEVTDSDLCGRSSWRKAIRLADFFWRRWVREYLPTLAPRRVPGSPCLVKVGDPVLIGDGELPRGTWPRGVIEALFPGRDGVVRVVDVRTQAGLLRRPLKKLVCL